MPYRSTRSCDDRHVKRNDLFRGAPMPEAVTEIVENKADCDDDNFNSSHILIGPNYCHTARLPVPSEILYLGILTETTIQIGVTGYDKGTSVQTILEATDDTDSAADSGIVQPMVLSYDEDDRQQCTIPLLIDHNIFFVGAKTGWRQLTLPNSFERAAYNSNDPLLHRFVAICLGLCPYRVCSICRHVVKWLNKKVNIIIMNTFYLCCKRRCVAYCP